MLDLPSCDADVQTTQSSLCVERSSILFQLPWVGTAEPACAHKKSYCNSPQVDVRQKLRQALPPLTAPWLGWGPEPDNY